MICPFFQPLKKLLKQDFFFDGIDVALPTIELMRVLRFEGEIGGARRLNVGSKARYNEGCNSDFFTEAVSSKIASAGWMISCIC